MHVSPPISDIDRDLAAILRGVAETPACEQGMKAGKRCGEKATAILVASCGHDTFYCDEHHGTAAAWLEKNAAVLRDGTKTLICADPRPPMHEAYRRVTVEWRTL